MENGGALEILSSLYINLYNISFSNNESMENGGGFKIEDSKHATLTNLAVENCTANV